MGTAFSKGKHTKKREGKNKKKIALILVVILLITGAVVFATVNKDKHLGNKAENEENIVDENAINEEDEEIVMMEENDVPEEQADNPAQDDFPDQIGGYQVIGQVVIDKIGVKKSILNKTTNQALKLSVTHFYGAKVNQVGNMVVTGHNIRTQFGRLKELSVGDTFYVINKADGSSVTYKIYDIFTSMPEDTDRGVNQNTNGKREVTLVTCNPGGLTRRIFKAREV